MYNFYYLCMYTRENVVTLKLQTICARDSHFFAKCMWNSLPDGIVTAPNTNCFKSRSGLSFIVGWLSLVSTIFSVRFSCILTIVLSPVSAECLPWRPVSKWRRLSSFVVHFICSCYFIVRCLPENKWKLSWVEYLPWSTFNDGQFTPFCTARCAIQRVARVCLRHQRRRHSKICGVDTHGEREPITGVWGRTDPPPTPPLCKNSSDLYKSQERPLAKVGWTCPSQSTPWRRPCAGHVCIVVCCMLYEDSVQMEHSDP